MQAVELARRVAAGYLRYAQGERLSMFLDLERLGLLSTYHSVTVLAARRREARALGWSANESGASELTVDVGELVAPFCAAIERVAAGRLDAE